VVKGSELGGLLFLAFNYTLKAFFYAYLKHLPSRSAWFAARAIN